MEPQSRLACISRTSAQLSSLGGRIGFAKVLSELMSGRVGYQPMLVTDHLVGAAGWFTSYLILVTMPQKLERSAARGQDEEKNASALAFVGSPSVLQFEEGAVKSPESPPAKQAPPRVLGGGRPALLPAPPPGSDVSLSSEARGKALRDRQAYLKNFWYACALSDKIRDQPVAAQLLGLKLVLFRDEHGAVRCLQDACPHRGAPLSTGWVSRPTDGRPAAVVCGYHGWAFDGRGVLREVPANSAGETLPQRPLLESFHVTEQAGFVWLFYGDENLPPDARPPLPLIPEFASPDWHPVYGEFQFDAPHGAVFENAIDFAHIHYLHNSSFGNQKAPQVRDMQASSGPFGVDTSFRIQNKPVNALWEWSRVPEVLVHAKALLPSTSVVGFTLSHGAWWRARRHGSCSADAQRLRRIDDHIRKHGSRWAQQVRQPLRAAAQLRHARGPAAAAGGRLRAQRHVRHHGGGQGHGGDAAPGACGAGVQRARGPGAARVPQAAPVVDRHGLWHCAARGVRGGLQGCEGGLQPRLPAA